MIDHELLVEYIEKSYSKQDVVICDVTPTLNGLTFTYIYKYIGDYSPPCSEDVTLIELINFIYNKVK